MKRGCAAGLNVCPRPGDAHAFDPRYPLVQRHRKGSLILNRNRMLILSGDRKRVHLQPADLDRAVQLGGLGCRPAYRHLPVSHSLESLRPSAVLFEQLSNPRPGHVVERQLPIHRVSAAEFRTAVSLYGRVRQVRIKCEVRPPPSRIGRQGQAAERLSVGRNARRGHIGIQIAE